MVNLVGDRVYVLHLNTTEYDQLLRLTGLHYALVLVLKARELDIT